jgi:beta-glucosidase
LKVTPDGDDFAVSCAVTNVGERPGTEVVQFYVRDDVSSVTTFDRSLHGFRRVALSPGETKEVAFVIARRDLQLFDCDGRWVVEPGSFTVWASASSVDDRLTGSFTVLPVGMTTAEISVRTPDRNPAN